MEGCLRIRKCLVSECLRLVDEVAAEESAPDSGVHAELHRFDRMFVGLFDPFELDIEMGILGRTDDPLDLLDARCSTEAGKLDGYR